MLVAVECQRLAAAFKIMPGSFSVAKEALVQHEPQLEQLPRGIIDEHQ